MNNSDKDDLISFIAGRVETMHDQMATKADIARLEDKLETSTTAIRGDIEQVHLRMNGIEHAVTSRIEQVKES